MTKPNPSILINTRTMSKRSIAIAFLIVLSVDVRATASLKISIAMKWHLDCISADSLRAWRPSRCLNSASLTFSTSQANNTQSGLNISSICRSICTATPRRTSRNSIGWPTDSSSQQYPSEEKSLFMLRIFSLRQLFRWATWLGLRRFQWSKASNKSCRPRSKSLPISWSKSKATICRRWPLFP